MAVADPATYEVKLNTIVNITNIGVNMTNERLKKMFENYGTISSYGVLNDHEPSRRFAFVTFEDSDAADEAVIELNGQLIDDNRCLRVRRTRKSRNNRDKPRSWSRIGKKENTAEEASQNESLPGESLDELDQYMRRHSNYSPCYNATVSQGHSLFVTHLDLNVDRRALRKAFSSYRSILEAKIIMHSVNGESKSRGYGFVTFAREEDAKNALREMNGRLIGTQGICVEIARINRSGHSDASSNSSIFNDLA